jgi:hypothetical protein
MDIIFTDSFTTKYFLGSGSFLLLLDRGKLIFKQNLKSIQYLKLDYAFKKLAITKKIRRIPLDASWLPENYLNTPFNSQYFAVENNFGTFTICEVETQEYRRLNVTKNMHEELYKILFADSFQYKYPTVENLIQEMPIYRPKLTEVILGQEGKIYLQITLTNYWIRQKATLDTAFYFDNMIATYDFKKDEITTLNKIDNKSLLPLYFSEIIPLTMGMAVHAENIEHPKESILSYLKLENKTYTKGQETNVLKNSGFIKFNINNVKERLLSFENYIIGRYDNKVYNIAKNKIINVNLTDSFSADMAQLYDRILDPFLAVPFNKALSKNEKGELILLFGYKKKSYLFNIETQQLVAIPKRVIHLCHSQKRQPLGFYKDAHTLVWLDWNKKQLVYYTHDLLD